MSAIGQVSALVSTGTAPPPSAMSANYEALIWLYSFLKCYQ